MTSIELHPWAVALRPKLPELVRMLEEDQGVTEVEATVGMVPPALQLRCRMETGEQPGELLIPLFLGPLWPGLLADAQVALELEINGTLHVFDHEAMLNLA